MTESYTAVLDRIVDGEHATLLLEADGSVVDEYVIDVGRVPEAGRDEGAVFRVTVEDDTIADLTYLPDDTTSRKQSAQDRLDRLSRPLSDEEN